MIRKITSADKEVFFSLTEQFYQSDAVLHPIPAVCHERTFEELMRSDVYLECLILEQNGQTAGYALLNKMYTHEMGGMVIWIEELYVLPEYRSCGLGTEFFQYLEQHYSDANFRLELMPDNQRAAKLYSRMGFEPLTYAQMVKNKEK